MIKEYLSSPADKVGPQAGVKTRRGFSLVTTEKARTGEQSARELNAPNRTKL
jgi:hypothetical protein